MKTSYVSYSLTQDDIYSTEGDVIGVDEYVLIDKVFVPLLERCKGKGREIMVDALEEIKRDFSGITVKIAALPFGEESIDMDDLVKFYETLGFAISDVSGDAVILEK